MVVGDHEIQAVEQAPQFPLGQLPQALPEHRQPIKRRCQDIHRRHRQVQVVVQLGQRCLVVGDGLLDLADALACRGGGVGMLGRGQTCCQ